MNDDPIHDEVELTFPYPDPAKWCGSNRIQVREDCEQNCSVTSVF